MLLPFQWAALTLEEAKLLMKYIEESTATKGDSRNYAKMRKAGVLDIYNKLREFVETAQHYEDRLRYFDPDDFMRDYDRS